MRLPDFRTLGTKSKYKAVGTSNDEPRWKSYVPGQKRTSSDGYKPAAIRLPTLLVFFFVLGLCLIPIEILLHNSTGNSSPSNQNRRSKWKRQLQILSDVNSAANDVVAIPSSIVGGLTGPAPISPDVLSSTPTTTTTTTTSAETISPQAATPEPAVASATVATAPAVPVSVPENTQQAAPSATPAAATQPAGVSATINSFQGSRVVNANPVVTSNALVQPQGTGVGTSAAPQVSNNIIGLSDSAPSATPGTSNAQLTAGGPSSAVVVSQNPSASEVIVTTAFTSIIFTEGSDGRSSSFSSVFIQTSILRSRPSTTREFSPTKTSSRHGGHTRPTNPAQPPNQEVSVGGQLSQGKFFAALYLGAILAVMMKVFWEWITESFKAIEPFHRLNCTLGTTANHSLFSQYLASSASFDAFNSLSQGHSLPLWMTSAYVCVIAITLLAPSSMTVRSVECNLDDHNTTCDPVLVINTALLRTVEALIALSMILVILVIVFTWKYRTGVSSSPSSILSVAMLLNEESLLRNFKDIDGRADTGITRLALQQHRFKLENHENLMGHVRFGITSEKSPVSPVATISWFDKTWLSVKSNLGGYTSVSNPANQAPPASAFPRNARSLVVDSVHILTSTALFALLVAYLVKQKSANNDLDFFDSGSISSKVVFMILAVVLSLQWKHLDREVRITEPYRRLAKGFARPENTILLPLSGTAWSTLPDCLCCIWKRGYKDMGFQALISFITVLSDINIIVIAGLILSSTFTLPHYLKVLSYSGHLSTAITILMVATLCLTIFWWRLNKTVRNMPRTPDSLASVISYLCASGMAREFSTSGIENLSEDERNRLIASSGRRFFFGKIIELDGRERWTVDFEEEQDEGDRVRRKEGRANTFVVLNAQKYEFDFDFGGPPPVYKPQSTIAPSYRELRPSTGNGPDQIRGSIENRVATPVPSPRPETQQSQSSSRYSEQPLVSAFDPPNRSDTGFSDVSAMTQTTIPDFRSFRISLEGRPSPSPVSSLQVEAITAYRPEVVLAPIPTASSASESSARDPVTSGTERQDSGSSKASSGKASSRFFRRKMESARRSSPTIPANQSPNLVRDPTAATPGQSGSIPEFSAYRISLASTTSRVSTLKSEGNHGGHSAQRSSVSGFSEFKADLDRMNNVS